MIPRILSLSRYELTEPPGIDESMTKPYVNIECEYRICRNNRIVVKHVGGFAQKHRGLFFL